MISVLLCVRDEHDLRLVVLAAVVCVVAALAALRFHERARTSTATTRRVFAVGAGSIAGGGVWATHFIAMLAYHPSLPISYDLGVTATSLVVAVVGMVLGFLAASEGAGDRRQAAAGALIGLSIVALHFIGIAAIRSSFGIEWRWAYVAVATLLAVAGASTALVVAGRTRGRLNWTLPPLALVLGIVGLHFTAMAAIRLVPDLSVTPLANVVARSELAWMTCGVTLLLIAASVVLSLVDAQHRKAGARRIEAIFQGLPSGLAMFGQDGGLIVWNEAYRRLLAEFSITPEAGATPHDLSQQMLRAGVLSTEPEGAARVRDIIDKHVAGTAQEWRAPSGRWVRIERTYIPGGTINLLNDITEAREAAEAMAQARDRAEAANRAKSEFLTNMSHEIRTPLNGILGMTQVMAAHDLSEPQRGRLTVVKESGQILLGLLDDILDLSKVQAGKLELVLGDVDAGQLVRSVAAAFEGAAIARDITLTAEIAPDAEGLWRLDGKRLHQVLANLVGNALKFTHEGSVRISAIRTREGLSFTVTDTGIGIAAEHLPHIFDQFAQADGAATRRYGGTGLGLAICRQLTSLMGGGVTAESHEGEGSCFEVTLPCDYLGAAAPAPADRDLVEVGRHGPLRILAAEDNATNQLVLRSLLQPLECELEIVEDGAKAVEAARTGRFDVILMDIQMPEMNGLDATLAIRRHEAATGRPPTPIVALSANVMSHQIEEYMAAGMDLWVAKPIELEKLYAALEGVLSENRVLAA